MIFRNNHSGSRGYNQNGIPDPITQDHNREHVPASELADASQVNFRIQRAGSASIDGAFLLQASTMALQTAPPI